MVFSPYTKITSITPHPKDLPSNVVFFAPKKSEETSNTVEYVRKINTKTDGFALHRRPSALSESGANIQNHVPTECFLDKRVE